MFKTMQRIIVCLAVSLFFIPTGKAFSNNLLVSTAVEQDAKLIIAANPNIANLFIL